MKRFLPFILSIVIVFGLVGCKNSVGSEMAPLDDYAYSITLNKQIVVVSNQVVSQMGNATKITNATKDNCISSAKASSQIVFEAIQEVKTMPAPAEYEHNKQNAIRIMELTKEHIDLFVSRMEADDETADYSDIVDLLQSDFTTLTAEFSNYYK